jgi:hypothetical protein
MQIEKRHLGRRIYNTVPGFLQGPCPKGPVVTVWHKQSGRTGFLLYWNGSWHSSFGQQDLYKLLGISPRVKKTGSQQGYPSEPVIQAVWRYLGKRYNEGDPDVTYSKSQPDLTKGTIGAALQYSSTDDGIRKAVRLAATLPRSGSGESDAHKNLKNRIAEHPDIIGAIAVTSVFIEHQYPSGDRVDLLLESAGSKWTVVEVELEGLVETVTGLFQAVKYRALQQAVLSTEKRQGSVSAVLAARSIPAEVMTMARMLGIETVEILDQEP